MAELEPSKLVTRVRFPSPAPPPRAMPRHADSSGWGKTGHLGPVEHERIGSQSAGVCGAQGPRDWKGHHTSRLRRPPSHTTKEAHSLSRPRTERPPQLNVLPQFMTELDGLDIHFLHVRSCHGDALPLIVTHGWPGSIIEQLKLIGPLTDPTAHRASEADAFDLVTPSLPGHQFSAKPTTTGWDPTRITRAWVVLMGRLGYPRFVAQGGDPPPPGLSEEERTAYAQLASFSATTWPMPPSWPPAPDPVRAGRLPGRPGRLHARPRRRDRPARPVKGVLEGTLESDLTRDDLLDHITLYWLTNTGSRRPASPGRTPPTSSTPRPSPSPSPSACSPTSRTRPPAAGPNAPTPTTSSTTTGSTGAATSPPGNNPNSSPKTSAPPSDHCGSRHGGATRHRARRPPRPREVSLRRAASSLRRTRSQSQ